VADLSGVFDLEGKRNPNVWAFTALGLMIFLIAEIGFTAFRVGNLGALVTSFLFIITIVAGFGFIDNLLFTEGHPLAPSLWLWIGFVFFNIGTLLSGVKFSLLSSATESYLAGILGPDAGILLNIVNWIFASHGETFLILGFSAGIYTIVKNTSLSELSLGVQYFIVSAPPSLIFAFLHGARSLNFLLLAFGINMTWTAILFYGELGDLPGGDIIGASLSLIVGLHLGFNVSSSGGLGVFFDTFFSGLGGTWGRAAALILIYMGLNLVFAVVYLVERSEEVL